MFCRKCGSPNDDNSCNCAQCGEVLQQVGATRPPIIIPSYLAQAILATLFCCLPFGIVAIVYAAQVNGKIAAGDINGAQRDSNNAKMWAWISFGIGMAWVGLYILYIIIIIISTAARVNV